MGSQVNTQLLHEGEMPCVGMPVNRTRGGAAAEDCVRPVESPLLHGFSLRERTPPPCVAVALQLHPGEAADRRGEWPPLLTPLLLPVRRRAVTRPVPLPHSERLTRDARST